MENNSELGNDALNLLKVLRKIEQVTEIRSGLYKIYKRNHETLKNNPMDEQARRSMAINLKREIKVFNMVRDSEDSVRGILSKAESAIKSDEFETNLIPLDKAEIMIGQIREIMKFAAKKTKKVENRLKMEKKLENSNYDPKIVNKFVSKFDKEREETDQKILSFLNKKVVELNKSFTDCLTKAELRAEFAVEGALVTPALIFSNERYMEKFAEKITLTIAHEGLPGAAIFLASILTCCAIIFGIRRIMYADKKEAGLSFKY